MPSLNIAEELKLAEDRIPKKEYILSKGLLQPFNNMNSASRKIMFGQHLEQRLQLIYSEPPLIQTGYEDEFGRYSSSFIVADDDYEVIANIPKFEKYPNHHYILILKSKNKNYYTMIERISYHHITETYGYLINNDTLDSLYLGSSIKNGDVIQKSCGYSEFNNKQDGVNLVTAYMSIHETTEDAICISETASKKLSSPLLKKISVIINDNDIPLNLYGDDNNYKSFPDIGEDIQNGILCAIRREKKEESLFTLSWERLKDILISDEKFTVEGKVIDINIACNNPEGLKNSFHNIQLYKYYEELINYSRKIVNTLSPIVNNKNITCSYDLLKLYQHHNMILNGSQWVKDRPFSNVVLDIIVLDIIPVKAGDKLSDRYGGKGVVSVVKPDHLMPRLDNGETVDVIFNDIGPVGRENPGQLIEISLNFISSRIQEYWSNLQDSDDYLEMYLEFMKLTVPNQYNYFKSLINNYSDIEKTMFLESLANGIYISIEPISESIDIDKLAEIYKHFPWIEPYNVTVPILDSNNNIRYTNARRRLVCGKKYIYRLEQYAENKFSATSLSATNIKNEPTKPKTNKIYKAPYAKTPIRFGEMETGNMLHLLNVYTVVSNLMIHSTSPHARRLAEHLLTDNPFDVNIELDDEARNRNAEILNTYLKTMGLRIVFIKKRRNLIKPISILPIRLSKTTNPIKPFLFIGKDMVLKPISKIETIKPIVIDPISKLKF